VETRDCLTALSLSRRGTFGRRRSRCQEKEAGPCRCVEGLRQRRDQPSSCRFAPRRDWRKRTTVGQLAAKLGKGEEAVRSSSGGSHAVKNREVRRSGVSLRPRGKHGRCGWGGVRCSAKKSVERRSHAASRPVQWRSPTAHRSERSPTPHERGLCPIYRIWRRARAGGCEGARCARLGIKPAMPP